MCVIGTNHDTTAETVLYRTDEILACMEFNILVGLNYLHLSVAISRLKLHLQDFVYI